MIQTLTVVRCNNCPTFIVGDYDGHNNREFNSLVEANKHGWVRRHGDDEKLIDLCPKCSEAGVNICRNQPTESLQCDLKPSLSA